ALEVVARERAGRRVPQDALVEARRLVEQLVQALAPISSGVLSRCRLIELDRNTEALRKPLDRTREVESLRLAHEGEDVTALPAAKAVVDALRGRDGKARRALFVEGAAAGELGTCLSERGALLDDRDEVGRLPNRLDARVLDPRHYRDAAYSS